MRAWECTNPSIHCCDSLPANCKNALIMGCVSTVLAEFVRCRFESSSKHFGWTGSPVMQKKDHRSFIRHVMVNGHHLESVFPQCLQNRCDFRFQHCDIARDGSATFGCWYERRPSVQAHAGVNRSAHLRDLEIIASDSDLVHRAGLFAHVTNDLCKLGCIKSRSCWC